MKKNNLNKILVLIIITAMIVMDIYPYVFYNKGVVFAASETDAAIVEAEPFSPENSVKGLEDLKKKVKKELSGKSGKWSVYVKNLNTNEYMLINDKKLPSASLIKLYIMMTAYNESAKKNIKENDLFNYRISSMITYSVNSTSNQLTSSLTKKGTFNSGRKLVNKYCKNNGYSKTYFAKELGLCSTKNVTSAKDCGFALERMYRQTCVNKKKSKKMIKLLKAQHWREKIPAGVPKGVKVANKTGETDVADNDAAIVYSKGADYVIVVMSKNAYGSTKEIKKISKIVYNYFNSSKVSVNKASLEVGEGTNRLSKTLWDDFTPELIDVPKSLKATKKKTIKTNAPEGVKVSYSVSNTKYATIDDSGVIKGKIVGKVKVSATFSAIVDGTELTKTVTTKNIKIEGKKKIYIDPGHQTKANTAMEPVGPGSSETKYKVTGGCVGVETGIPEYKFNLTVAKKLKKELIAQGYDVVLSRTKNNVNISNVERAKKGNKSGADICIRIHSDSWTDSSLRGVSVLYPSTDNPYPVRKQAKKSKKLAKKLIKEYCKSTGFKNRGIVVRNDLSGTNWSTIPTVLIECGFQSNPTEDVLLNDPKMQKKMVSGMVKGIDKYFGY